MTTIAFDGETLAVDSRITREGAVVGTADKSIETEDFIGAICGDFVTIPLLRTWVRASLSEQSRPKLPKGSSFILVLVHKRTGRVTVYEDGLSPLEMDDRVFAYGSGAAYALGAMHAGATAKQAVQAAAAYDGATGGRVRQLAKGTV